MVKVVLMKKRCDGVSVEKFKEFMIEEHAKKTVAKLPNIQDYTLFFPLDENQEYDSVEIHEYDSLEDLRVALDSDAADKGHDRFEGVVDLDTEIIAKVDDGLTLEELHNTERSS